MTTTETIKSWVDKSNMSRKDFAKSIGKSERYVYYMFKYPKRMTVEDINKLSNVIGKTPLKIFRTVNK